MAKYKNKNGISLNYSSDDIHTKLIKEVVGEAIKLLDTGQWSTYIRIKKAVAFLKENFDIKEKNNDEWLRNSKK